MTYEEKIIKAIEDMAIGQATIGARFNTDQVRRIHAAIVKSLQGTTDKDTIQYAVDYYNTAILTRMTPQELANLPNELMLKCVPIQKYNDKELVTLAIAKAKSIFASLTFVACTCTLYGVAQSQMLFFVKVILCVLVALYGVFAFSLLEAIILLATGGHEKSRNNQNQSI